jgi:hypothetical protein
MDMWNIAEYAAWGISALLLLWMLADTIRVGMEYDEAFLLSSREGADELLDSDYHNGGTK